MSRALIFGNDIVSFTPSTGAIVINGYVPLQKLLLINNATINSTLYNFSDPNTKAVCTFDAITNTTLIDLTLDTSSMSSSDKLQIYYEREELEIKPARSYRDSVSKFRVSEPQTLIDTDFEYGLQPTKWETVRLVNNVPTSYVAQNTEDALLIDSISVSAGSDIVTVNTVGAHNLIKGSVVEIVGLKDSKFEGVYIVKDIGDIDTFTYKVPFKISTSKNLYTIYSLIYPGSFYTGASVEIADVSTQTPSATKLKISTDYTHGFNEKTKLYLKKSRAVKSFVFQSPQNVVSGSATTNYRSQITPSGPIDTQFGANSYYYNQKIITDDWIGFNEINLDTNGIPINGNTITYKLSEQFGNASLASNALKTGDMIAFYTPEGNSAPQATFPAYSEGSPPSVISLPAETKSLYMVPLYVFDVVISGDEVSFKVSNVFGVTNTGSNFLPGTTTYGRHRILRGAKITSITSADEITYSSPSSTLFNNNDQVVVIYPNPKPTGLALTLTKHNGQRLRASPDDNYELYTVTSAGVSSLKFVSPSNVNTDFRILNFNKIQMIGIFRVNSISLANQLYLPPNVAGFSSSAFQDGFFVDYQTTGVAIGGLLNNQRYLVKKDTLGNWFKIYPANTIDFNTATNINLFFPTANATGVYNATHTFTTTLRSPVASSIQIINPPRGELSENSIFDYSTASTPINPLNTNLTNTYRAKISDTELGSDRLRVGTNPKSLRIFQFNYTANAATATINVYDPISIGNTNPAASAGITNTSVIQAIGYDNISFIQKLFCNGLFRVVSIGATTPVIVNSVTTTVQPITVGIETTVRNTFASVSISGNQVSNTQVTGIVSFTDIGGSGSHFLTQNIDGAADDIYQVINSGEDNFEFDTNVTIPEIVKNVNAISTATNSIKIIDHFFADGTAVVYTTTGTAIGGLTPGNTYYVRSLDKDFLSLALNSRDAIDRINGILISITSIGSGTHTFTTQSIKGFLAGTGTIGISSSSNLVTGTVSCKFFSDFSNGDIFRIYRLNPSGNVPGDYFESKVTSVKSDRILKLENNPGFTTTTAGYFVPTTIYTLSDGKSVHKPFDGGVNMTAGLIPNSQIIRQTRKYFRYQSGKGIQVSMAVNFNPTFDIDLITPVGSATTTHFYINCKFPHQISPESIGTNQRIKITGITGIAGTVFNREVPFPIVGFDPNDTDFTFIIDAGTSVSGVNDIGGFAQYSVINWIDCSIKSGLFDDQNGFYYEYDGNTLYAVRRSSTQQISGTVTAVRSSHRIEGSDSLFLKQLSRGDRVIIRGQTYKVIKVINNNFIDVQPAYRGNTTSDIIISKVINTRVPQSQWNIDRMDGTGVSGYKIDINKIQMIYMDYSWYGAGTIRFGFKDQFGEVRYCHEFYHNNVFTESYMRSGNVPARYEVETFDRPLFSPSLFHWGVSVIMDGRFDDDKSYLFTAESKALPFTNGGIANTGSSNSDTRVKGNITIGSNKVTGINKDEASVVAVGEVIVDSGIGTAFPTGTTITAIEIDQSSDTTRFQNTYALTVSNPATINNNTERTFNIFSGNQNSLKVFIPLVSIRLAPSVDNSNTGNLGFRDIVNRMQLTLKSAGVLVSHDCEVRLVLNAKLSNDNFSTVGSPSLSQIYRHEVGDTYSGGINIFAFRAQGGGVSNSATGRRTLNVTTVSLDEIALLGNSILGGDGVFPDGPDILTVAVKPVDTSQITGSSPFLVSARITWAEAQA